MQLLWFLNYKRTSSYQHPTKCYLSWIYFVEKDQSQSRNQIQTINIQKWNYTWQKFAQIKCSQWQTSNANNKNATSVEPDCLWKNVKPWARFYLIMIISTQIIHAYHYHFNPNNRRFCKRMCYSEKWYCEINGNTDIKKQI